MSRLEHGFSLVELLIVVTILGIAAAVAVPDISTTNTTTLQLAAEEIAQAMRFARSEAIRTGQPHGFRLQPGAKTIQVYRPDTGVSPWAPIYDVYHPVSKKLYAVDLEKHPFAKADLIVNATTFFGACNISESIYFDSNGAPYCADPETVLLSKFNTTLTLGRQSSMVTLSGITGRVTVQ